MSRCHPALIPVAIALFAVQAEARDPERPARTDYTDVIRRIEERVPGAMEQNAVPGVAIALVDTGGIVWSKGFGFTDRTHATPVSDSTLFSVQSISKTYTAAALLRAASLGTLNLDDRLTRHVPEFTIRSRFGAAQLDAITIRHLLAHRGGLPHEAPIGSNYDDVESTFEEHIRSIHNTWLLCPVGSRFSYSNLGIDLGGYALQRAAGSPFESLVDTLIFAPLGMRRSSFSQDAAFQLGGVALGHVGDRTVPRMRIPMIAAGGMYSTVKDMGRFVAFMLRGGDSSLVAPHLLREMTTPQFPVPGQMGGYGLGVYVVRAFGTWRLGHEGGGYGYSAGQRWVPAHGIGVVVLTNQGRGSLGPGLAAGIIQLMLQAKLGRIPADSTPVAPLAVHGVHPPLEPLVGTYKAPGGIAEFVLRDQALRLVRGRDTLALTPVERRAFGGPGITATFDAAADGSVRGVTVVAVDFRSNGVEYWPRNDSPTDPPGPGLPAWSTYVGEYEGRSYGAPVRTRFFLRNGYLYTSWGDGQRLQEREPGLFFTPEGESIEFRPGEVVIGNRRFARIP